MANKYVRFDDDEAAKMLIALAGKDLRSEGNEVIWLIRQEWERRGLGDGGSSLIVVLGGEKEAEGSAIKTV